MTISRMLEEKFHKEAMIELELGKMQPCVWDKAVTHADGDDKKAGSLYLKFRTESMMKEARARRQCDKSS